MMTPTKVRKNRIAELVEFVNSIDGEPGVIFDAVIVEAQRRFYCSTFTAKDYATTVMRVTGKADGWLKRVQKKEDPKVE
jgi:hypothetical protein